MDCTTSVKVCSSFGGHQEDRLNNTNHNHLIGLSAYIKKKLTLLVEALRHLKVRLQNGVLRLLRQKTVTLPRKQANKLFYTAAGRPHRATLSHENSQLLSG